jgi:hypothetical protein
MSATLVSVDGGRYRNKFTPLLEEIMRWQTIISFGGLNEISVQLIPQK